MVRELKAGCISCDHSITCFGAMVTFVVSNYLCNHRAWFGTSPEPDALNPEINRCKQTPVKKTERQIHKIIKNQKRSWINWINPKKINRLKKGPIPLTTYGTSGSLFQCSHFPPLASPHAFLVLMQLQWSRHAGPGGLKVGHLDNFFFQRIQKTTMCEGKDSKNWVDLRGIPPTCLWPKFHTCIFASTAMSAVEVLRTIAFWTPSKLRFDP